MKKIGTFIPLVALLVLASCTTTKGGLFKQVVNSTAPPKGSSSVEVQSSDTNPEQTGLEVQTTPSDAQVYLNDSFIGDTPLLYTDFQAGSYKITIRKRGYYENVRWLNLDPTAYTILQTDLAPKMGYIVISSTPSNAEITIDGEQYQAGVQQVPVGHHVVRVREFGFEDWTRDIIIQENQTVQLNAQLVKAPFRISGLATSRRVLNPANPGLLGKLTVSFEVSTYGSGAATITDSAGKQVFNRAFPQFTQREQSFTWNGRDASDALLPDGSYTIHLQGRENASSPPSSEEVTVTIDRGAFVGIRSMLSGTSGLLFSATPEVLPPSSYSFGSLAIAHIEAAGAIVPVQLYLRAVPYPGIEIDGQGTMQLTSAGNVPYSVGASGKFSLIRPSSQSGFQAAVSVKATYQSGTTADTLTNFSGISLGAPIEYRFGPAALVLMPEVIAAPYPASYSSSSSAFAPTFWGYGRGGVFLDFGSFMTGLSAAVRTQPFSQGLGLASVPLAGGWELHWLIPNTQLVLSGAVTGEYSPGSNGGYYLMAGAGVSFVN